MIKYYPLTRIKANLYTRGDEYKLPNGKSYVGRYYLTFDGNAYTGINPVLGTNQLLVKIQKEEFVPVITPTLTSQYIVAQSQNIQDTLPKSSVELTELSPYYPLPINDDYTRGYFTRYFAKNVSGPGYVIEISQADWAKLQNGDVSPTMLGYESTSMLWQLTGPLHDTRVSQYQIKGGVYDTNKRVTEAKAVGFVGLVAFIGGDYTKFARITPDVATTGSR